MTKVATCIIQMKYLNVTAEHLGAFIESIISPFCTKKQRVLIPEHCSMEISLNISEGNGSILET